jgi:hypothetical protein
VTQWGDWQRRWRLSAAPINHPTTIALKAAAESGAERDIKNARALFLRLKQSDRRAALAMLDG